MRQFVVAMLAVTLTGLASFARAQSASAVTPPPNVVLPNANGVPVGPFGGLESAAYAARVADPSATWFNPAGLSRAKTAQISGSAGLFQFIAVSPTTLPNSGGATQQLPNLVGFSLNAIGNCTVGFTVLTTNAWQQETDAELILGTTTAAERFGYSADSSFSQRNLTVGGGCERGRLRYGAGLAAALTSLRLVETASDRLATSTGLRTAILSSRKTGSTFQLRPVFGMQFDARPSLQFGLVVRTPAATLYRSGGIAVDANLENAGDTRALSLFDDDARFTYSMPWEFQGGIAYLGKRAQIEADVQAFTGVSTYTMLGTDNPVISYLDSGNGTAPSIDTTPFDGFKSGWRGTANFTAGGHYELSASGKYMLHAGFTLDRSPVADADEIFTRVNTHSWTVGVSGRAAKLIYAVGLNLMRGTSADVVVRDLVTGQPVTTALKLRTTALIYSLGYQF